MSHQFCVCAFCSLSLSCKRSNTRGWPNVGLLLAHRLRRWANISPVLGYRAMFDATLHVDQRHRGPANINPAFAQSIVSVLQPAWSRPTDYGWMDTSQHRRRWPNITRHWDGVGLHCMTRSQANTRRWTSAGFMLGQHRRRWARIGTALRQRLVFAGSVDRPLCVLHVTGCEDIKTVAQLIEPSCRSSSQQQILTQRGVANLVGEDVQI